MNYYARYSLNIQNNLHNNSPLLPIFSLPLLQLRRLESDPLHNLCTSMSHKRPLHSLVKLSLHTNTGDIYSYQKLKGKENGWAAKNPTVNCENKGNTTGLICVSITTRCICNIIQKCSSKTAASPNTGHSQKLCTVEAAVSG